MTHYDLAIIGSGSGNSLPDERFDGKKIAILEEGTFGGTCLNVGCIPTKMFVYAAEVARTVTTAEKYGVDATLDGVRWSDIVKRVFGRIDPISAGGERYRSEDSPNTTVYRGHATFTGDKTIDTGTGETITADQVVIAAGSRPIIPDEIASSGVKYYTNEDIMRLPELPEHLVIVAPDSSPPSSHTCSPRWVLACRSLAAASDCCGTSTTRSPSASPSWPNRSGTSIWLPPHVGTRRRRQHRRRTGKRHSRFR